MEELAQRLSEELQTKDVFTVPLFGGIGISESVVVTWIIMGVFWLIFLLLTRNLRVTSISRRQAAAESAATALQQMAGSITGPAANRYTPYLVSVLIYVGAANLMGIIGFKPPTKDLNVTAALALMSIFLIEYAGLHKRGIKGWLKGFLEPFPFLLPLNLLEILIRPLSLCMRLFGNVLGSFVIMALIQAVAPVIVPVPFNAYFDVFDGLIQAYVFVFLTGLFIKESVGE